MTDCVTVLTTAGTRDLAARIAQALVEERLAACVQMLPIESWYRWEGRVCNAPELLLLVKTLASQVPAVEARIRALHDYAVPEIAVLPLVGGAADYLQWLRDNAV